MINSVSNVIRHQHSLKTDYIQGPDRDFIKSSRPYCVLLIPFYRFREAQKNKIYPQDHTADESRISMQM